MTPTNTPVELFPWARVRRDYTPAVAGYYILFEGLLGVVDGTLQETTYAKAKSEGEKKDGIAYSAAADNTLRDMNVTGEHSEHVEAG